MRFLEHERRLSPRFSSRRGVTMTEMLLTLAMAVVVLPMMTRMAIRFTHLSQDQQRQTRCQEHLANLMEYIRCVPFDEIETESLVNAPWFQPFASELPGGRIDVDVANLDDTEKRITLTWLSVEDGAKQANNNVVVRAKLVGYRYWIEEEK